MRRQPRTTFALAIISLVISALILALPLFLGCDPWDAAHFVDAGTFRGKIDALRDGLRHKRGESEAVFRNGERELIITMGEGVIYTVDVSDYAGDIEARDADVEEARRILCDWGIHEWYFYQRADP